MSIERTALRFQGVSIANRVLINVEGVQLILIELQRLPAKFHIFFNNPQQVPSELQKNAYEVHRALGTLIRLLIDM